MHDAVKKAKENKDATVANWEKIMGEFAKSSDDFAKLAAKPDANQPEVKKAYTSVKKTCSDCHEVFRIEEDSFK